MCRKAVREMQTERNVRLKILKERAALVLDAFCRLNVNSGVAAANCPEPSVHQFSQAGADEMCEETLGKGSCFLLLTVCTSWNMLR